MEDIPNDPVAPIRKQEKATAFLKGEDVVVYGEDPKEFDALVASVNAVLKPSNFIEHVWVRDFAYLQWDIIRYRRLKAHFLSLRRRAAMAAIYRQGNKNFKGIGGGIESATIERWIFGDEETVSGIDQLLENEGGGKGAVIAEAVFAHIGKIEIIEKLTAEAEFRRDRMLRNLQKWRDANAEIIDQLSKAPASDDLTKNIREERCGNGTSNCSESG